VQVLNSYFPIRQFPLEEQKLLSARFLVHLVTLSFHFLLKSNIFLESWSVYSQGEKQPWLIRELLALIPS